MIRVILNRSSVRCDSLRMAVPLSASIGAAAATATLLNRVAEERRERTFILEVCEPLSQRRWFAHLPRVGRGSTLRILALDVSRQFRERESAMIDGRWMRSASGERQFVAAAVASSLLDEVCAIAAQNGWTLAYAEPSAASFGLRWIPRQREVQRTRQWRRAGIAAWVCAISMVVCGALLLHRRLEQRRDTFIARIRELAPRVSVLARMQEDNARLEAELRLLEDDGDHDVLLRRAARLLASVPESAYVSRLMVRDTGAAEMSGGAARASSLGAAALRAHVPVPATAITTGGKDSFRRGWQSFALRTEATGW